MKNIISAAMAGVLAASVSTMALASNTTTLTTVVPGAVYTLNIPADQEIPYATTRCSIGEISVTESSGFAVGKNLNVTVTYGAFTSPTTESTIPFELIKYRTSSTGGHTSSLASGQQLVFEGTSSGSASAGYIFEASGNIGNELELKIDAADWGSVTPGTYSSTITFTAEVVSE